jgi:hypothetical protein
MTALGSIGWHTASEGSDEHAPDITAQKYVFCWLRSIRTIPAATSNMMPTFSRLVSTRRAVECLLDKLGIMATNLEDRSMDGKLAAVRACGHGDTICNSAVNAARPVNPPAASSASLYPMLPPYLD